MKCTRPLYLLWLAFVFVPHARSLKRLSISLPNLSGLSGMPSQPLHATARDTVRCPILLHTYTYNHTHTHTQIYYDNDDVTKHCADEECTMSDNCTYTVLYISAQKTTTHTEQIDAHSRQVVFY